ncbi:MAG: oligosaccharide flippase family protein, partial [Nanoarchaeota archaeon]|nr:oligosaccharide flippase family protein [Nanoarchaeota archaeon]
MTKQINFLVKNSFIFGVSTFIQKALGFILLPIYTTYLSTKDYGIIAILEILFLFATLFLSVRISESLLRYYYEPKIDKKKVVSTSLLFTFFFGLILTTILALLSKEASSIIFNIPKYSLYISIILITVFFNLTNTISMTYIRAEFLSKLFLSIEVIRILFAFSTTVYLIVFLKMGILGFLLSGAITALLSSVTTTAYTISKTGLGFSLDILKKMIKFSYPLIISEIFFILLLYIDLYLLKNVSNLSSVGIYSLGHKFGLVVFQLIVFPVTLIWFPYAFSIKKDKEFQKLQKKFLYLFTATLFLFVTSLSLFIKPIIRIIASPEYINAYKVVPWVAFA